MKNFVFLLLGFISNFFCRYSFSYEELTIKITIVALKQLNCYSKKVVIYFCQGNPTLRMIVRSFFEFHLNNFLANPAFKDAPIAIQQLFPTLFWCQCYKTWRKLGLRLLYTLLTLSVISFEYKCSLNL